jgi:hypothetical protein
MLGILANGPTWEICLKKKKKKKTLVLTNVEKRAVGGGITYPPDLWIWTIQNQSSGYLKITKIKKSPQFGWVKKLQRTAGFQTVRGGYLVFFPKPVWEPQRYQPWYPPSQTDWPATVGRNYTEAVCPGRFSHRKSVCPSVRRTVRAGSAGGLKRGTVASRTDGQTTWIYM